MCPSVYIVNVFVGTAIPVTVVAALALVSQEKLFLLHFVENLWVNIIIPDTDMFYCLCNFHHTWIMLQWCIFSVTNMTYVFNSIHVLHPFGLFLDQF